MFLSALSMSVALGGTGGTGSVGEVSIVGWEGFAGFAGFRALTGISVRGFLRLLWRLVGGILYVR